ncbi:MAG: pyridoxal-phosphate dependent enzyme, partial [Nitrospirae bacterium]
SLAIGNPADGYYATKVIEESGGYGEDVSDEEIIDAIKLLAKTEGIFAETAGGVTLASAIKLIKSGRIKKDELTVICITGNGLKTQEALIGKTVEPYHVKPNIASFEEALKKIEEGGG